VGSSPGPGWDALGSFERATQRCIGVVANLQGDVEKTPLRVTHEQLCAVHAPVPDVVGPLPPRAAHHTTHDHIVRVDGDTATIEAHLMVHEVRGATPPDRGWPSGASGGRGEIVLSEMDHYRVALIRSAGTWRIAINEVTLDLPLPLTPEPV
jgi:hypothetical protein